MSLFIYGASDDLIEIEGDLDDEFMVDYDSSYFVSTSSGFVIRIDFEGDWKIMAMQTPVPDARNYNFYPAGTKEAVDIAHSDDTDVIELLGDPVTWVVGGTQYMKAGKKAKL